MTKQFIIGSYKRGQERAKARLAEHVKYLKAQGLYDNAKAQPQLNKLATYAHNADLEYKRALAKYS